jgi:hypothetical protein
MLEEMDLGHKVAAMPGKKRMTYDADALGPVSDIVCIVSGLGAPSAYGLLREVSRGPRMDARSPPFLKRCPFFCAQLLTDRGAGIEQASLLWVNKVEALGAPLVAANLPCFEPYVPIFYFCCTLRPRKTS